MSEPTAEERAERQEVIDRWRAGEDKEGLSTITQQEYNTSIEFEHRLIAGIERLEKERDELRRDAMKVGREADQERDVAYAERNEARECQEQAEAQLAEAVAFREWVADYAKAWREEEYGPTGEDLRSFVKQLHTKLAGLSTVTPKVDVIYMTRDQTERRGQVCERVSGFTGNGTPYSKCDPHGCPWPSGTKRCPAAMTGNTTT